MAESIGSIRTIILLDFGVVPSTDLDFITDQQQLVLIPSAAGENSSFVEIVPCYEVFCEKEYIWP